MVMSKHHQVVIIGGGTAGIMTAAQLKKHDRNMDVALIEPSDKHFYQLSRGGAHQISTFYVMLHLIPKLAFL